MGNDEAADWFELFWKEKDFSLLIEEITDFDPSKERYDSVRAACYLLETLGVVYIWPAAHSAQLKPILGEAIEILGNMIDPPDESWSFLDMWGSSPEVIKAVEQQIETLKVRYDAILF